MNLATVERVLEVQHHPNADKLDIIKVLGYECIVGREAYNVGDLVVFVQPDSILPSDRTWCQDLLRYTSKGRIRAVRLRGEWSMGLVVPVSVLVDECVRDPDFHGEGSDFTEELGITKYEPALPLSTQARGGLPFQIPRTDEERWQNLRNLDSLMGQEVDVTLKIDGSSATYYCLLPGQWPGEDKEKAGLCSRSLELKVGEDENGVTFDSKWHQAERNYNILEKLKDYCYKHGVSLALRGEIYGPGIQSFAHNPHSKGEDISFAAYSVYNITEKKYERLGSPHYFVEVARTIGVPSVPFDIDVSEKLTREMIDKYDHGLKRLDGKPFEGVVVQHANGSFKIINKWYDAEKE